MTIHAFWLFDSHSNCLYSRNWHSDLTTNGENLNQLVFGIVFSLRNVFRKFSEEDTFVAYKTSNYKLHFYETASNLKFVLITSSEMPDKRSALKQIHSNLYLEYIVKNPLNRKPDQVDGSVETVECELFTMGLDAFISSLDGY